MQILIYIFILFSILQFCVVLYNYLFRDRFKGSVASEEKCVSVLIPARNEEFNIANILDDLMDQTYTNIEIIICNDHSEDNTKAVLEQYSKKDPRIKFIDSEPLPENWFGKNWACHQLSKIARGNYFLFLDADVRVHKTLISKSIYYLNKKNLSLMSIFPIQIMKTQGEYFTVPLMHYILVTLLPLPLVERTSFASLSAANGQCMLYRAVDYKNQQPHEKMKRSKVEDIQIARNFKKQGIKIACLTGIEEISCRMYSGYRDGITGFSKNMAAFFGNSYLVAFIFWGVTTIPLMWIPLYGNFMSITLFFLLYMGTKILFSLISKQNIIKNILFTIPQHLTMLIILIHSIYTQLTRKQQWKGRSIT